MKIRPYRYYLIDLDRTLWDFDANSEHAIGLLITRNPRLLQAVTGTGNLKASLKDGIENIRKHDVSVENALHSFFLKYDKLNHQLWALYEAGEMSKEDLRWKRFHEAFRWYGVDDEDLARKFGEDYLEQMILENRLMPGAVEMLESIRSSGGRMAILSNGFKEVQYRKLRGSGIDGFFDAVVVSEEAGCLKPRPGIFAYAVERLSGIRRQDNPEAWREAKRQTLMIGDDPVNDILGAQIFGIDQFFYNHKRTKAISHATYESQVLPVFSGNFQQ